MQHSLVSLYGQKPLMLQNFLETRLEQLVSIFGSVFSPYSMDQIHATICGLEHIMLNGLFVNLNFYTLRNEKRIMHMAELLQHLRSSEILPIDVRIGGYKSADNYGFTSNGKHPYERSFLINDDKVVMMGWPVRNGIPAYDLANFRKSFEKYNVLHKWHKTSNDLDNDFYFVLGKIDPGMLRNDEIRTKEHCVRNTLSTSAPFDIRIDMGTLSIVSYKKPDLPASSTNNILLDNFTDTEINNLLDTVWHR